MSDVDTRTLEDEFSAASNAIPARAVMARAESLRRRLGHENLGFLSERHGFLPFNEPLRQLPAEFAAWDEAAARLPELYRSLRLRRELDALPLLDAGRQALADDFLLRAALVLGFLAQSYWYVEVQPPEQLPAALERPWQQVRARLGRPEQTVSVVDLIYNWRIVDRRRPDTLSVENLRLMVPTVDTPAEHVFYLTPLEILAQAVPMVTAMVRAQEAAVLDDHAVLESQLLTLLDHMERLQTSLAHIDPNPRATTHVDPVVWARTVAPLVVPLTAGDQGPSGTASPIFLALDLFLGRKRFDTYLGREVHRVRTLYPPLWQEFLNALGKVSVPDLVGRCKDPTLVELLRQLIESYVGTGGFLGRHRMKVHGYLELAFKVGRSVTITGFQGVFTDRTWEVVDSELELSRREREPQLPKTCHRVRVKRVVTYAAGGRDEVNDVVLDVSGLPLRFQPGDHCCVLPENTEPLVERTLTALGARGDEPLTLTPAWREASRLRRDDGRPAAVLTARELLRYGHIRPVSAATARALYDLSGDSWLAGLTREGDVHRFELWELLRALGERGFPGMPLEALCTVVPPARFRPYSISSAADAEDGELRLTVARLRYSAAGELREGAASAFLARTAGRTEPISIRIERSPRFALPSDPALPLLMIAGGSGIAPFRSFLAERMRTGDAGEALLLLGLRSEQDLLAADDIVAARRRGMLRVQVALSRPTSGPARRIDDLLTEPATAQRLRELLDRRAHVYICGGQGFVRAAMTALDRITGTALLEKLTAEGRLQLEAFAGHDPDQQLPEFDWSQIARHNDERSGHWIVLGGRVYDIDAFMRRHPGGVRILRNWAGTDATAAFARSHHDRADIDAMRELYAIGSVRDTPLPVHRAWAALLRLVVEMQNALANDQDLQRTVTTRDDPAPHLSPYNLQRAVETHQRFLRSYLDVLLDESLENIWTLTQANMAMPVEPSWMCKRITELRDSDDMRWLNAATSVLYRTFDHLVAQPAATGTLIPFEEICRTLATHNRELLGRIKEILCRAVAVFEELGTRVLADGGAPLVAACEDLLSAIGDYPTRLRHRLSSLDARHFTDCDNRGRTGAIGFARTYEDTDV